MIPSNSCTSNPHQNPHQPHPQNPHPYQHVVQQQQVQDPNSAAGLRRVCSLSDLTKSGGGGGSGSSQRRMLPAPPITGRSRTVRLESKECDSRKSSNFVSFYSSSRITLFSQIQAHVSQPIVFPDVISVSGKKSTGTPRPMQQQIQQAQLSQQQQQQPSSSVKLRRASRSENLNSPSNEDMPSYMR